MELGPDGIDASLIMNKHIENIVEGSIYGVIGFDPYMSMLTH